MSDAPQSGPCFDVIMPVYNYAAYLGEAIESVLAQSWKHWTLYIMDDGSTDGSGEIARGYAQRDPRIVVLRQENAGPAAARNAAVAAGRAPWLAFLDSDDIWLPTTLALYARHIQDHPDIRFFYGYRHSFDQDGESRPPAREFQDRPTGAEELFGRIFLSMISVCYRRDLFESVGGFDTKLRMLEDYDLYLRLSLHCRFYPLNAETGSRRRHSKNISRQTGYSRMLEARILWRFLENGGREHVSPATVEKRMAKLYYAAARQYLRAGCFPQSLVAARLANQFRPTPKNLLVMSLAAILLPFGKTDGRDAPPI